MAPFTHEAALAELNRHQQMWATDPALVGDHAGLEEVLARSQRWLEMEYRTNPEGARRDQKVRKGLKEVEGELDEVSSLSSKSAGSRR